MGRMLKQSTMRVSQIVDMQYSLSYLVASSMGGCASSVETDEVEPIDITVGMNIDIKEFPNM